MILSNRYTLSRPRYCLYSSVSPREMKSTVIDSAGRSHPASNSACALSRRFSFTCARLIVSLSVAVSEQFRYIVRGNE